MQKKCLDRVCRHARALRPLRTRETGLWDLLCGTLYSPSYGVYPPISIVVRSAAGNEYSQVRALRKQEKADVTHLLAAQQGPPSSLLSPDSVDSVWTQWTQSGLSGLSGRSTQRTQWTRWTQRPPYSLKLRASQIRYGSLNAVIS